MKFLHDTTWEEVFSSWRSREANNPGWVRCATEIKGWPDWESWRRFTASQIDAENRSWQIFEVTEPTEEVPQFLVGPFSGWQSRVTNKNKTTFQELLDTPKQYQHFSKHEGVVSILNHLPFATEFIGIVRGDIRKVACLEGHHRATAIALAKKEGKQIDFSKVRVTVALTHLPAGECSLFDEILKRGSSKNSHT